MIKEQAMGVMAVVGETVSSIIAELALDLSRGGNAAVSLYLRVSAVCHSHEANG
jgi:hypothetical protein